MCPQKMVRKVASVHVLQRVRSMDFTSDGECLVTCGDCHIGFWRMPSGSGSGSFAVIGRAEEPGSSSCDTRVKAAAGAEPASGEGNGTKSEGSALEGWSVNIADELEGAIFVDVVCDKETSRAGEGHGTVFGVTAQGVLCAFTR